VDAASTWWVLVTFDAGIGAEDAYGWWDRSIRGRLERPRPVEEALRALARGDPQQIAATMHNSLEPGVIRRHPSVAAARDALGAAGAVGVLLSGSGPTVAALCRDRDRAVEVADRVGGIATRSLTDRGGPPTGERGGRDQASDR
jgi:4-diphosphocytidyl-2-C-methyl-D-erythritol kinase